MGNTAKTLLDEAMAIFPAMRYWICDVNQNARPVSEVEWHAWLRAEHDGTHPDIRRVASDELPNGARVSTVFLIMDHNFTGFGPPVLWETMIFGLPGEEDDYQMRYSSVEEAREGHKQAITWAHTRLALRAMGEYD